MVPELKNITKAHIEYALRYIVNNGRRGKKGIFYFFYTAHKRGIEYKVNGKIKYVAIPDVLRIAMLHAKNQIPKKGEFIKDNVDIVSGIISKNRGLDVGYILDTSVFKVRRL